MDSVQQALRDIVLQLKKDRVRCTVIAPKWESKSWDKQWGLTEQPSTVINKWIFQARESLCQNLLSSTPVYEDLQVCYKVLYPWGPSKRDQASEVSVEFNVKDNERKYRP